MKTALLKIASILLGFGAVLFFLYFLLFVISEIPHGFSVAPFVSILVIIITAAGGSGLFLGARKVWRLSSKLNLES